MEDTGTCKTVQLVFTFGGFNMRRDYMVSGNLIREYSLIA